MHLLFKIFNLIFLIALSIDLQAQFSREFEQVDIVVDGFKSGRVTDFESDADGYLWITCFDGLLRYDGYTFERFSHDPDDNRSLPGDYSEVLHLDKRGDLWIGTDGGIARYDRLNNDFECYSPDSAGAPIGFIVDITDGPDSTLWVAVQEGGLYSFNQRNGKFIRHLGEGSINSIANEMVRVLLADRQGFIWIGLGFGLQEGRHGLIKYDPRNGTVNRYQSDPEDERSLLDNRVSALMQDNLDRIFIGTYKNGLHLYDKSQDNFIRMESNHPLSTLYPPEIDHDIWYTDPFVSILKQDSKGGYWVGTIGAGLHYFSTPMDHPILYSHNSTEKGGLMNNLLWTLHEDPFNNIWVGDLGGVGIHKFDPTTPLFQKIRAPNSFYFKDLSVLDDHTLILVDRENNIYSYDINDQWSLIDIFDRDIEIHAIHSRPNTDDIWLTATESQGDTRQATLIHLSAKNFAPKFYYPKRELSNSYQYTDLFEDENNRLWLATGTRDLHIFDPKKENFTIKTVGTEKATKIDEIFQSDGNIWLTDRENKIVLKFNRISDSFSIEVSGYDVRSICARDSTLLLGTAGGLLLEKDISGNIFEISISQGSSRSEINMLEPDLDGRLWIGSGKGLFVLDSGAFIPRFVALRGFLFKKYIEEKLRV